MPDIISVISKRWKLIFSLTLLATIIALVASLLSPKKYLSTTTALPANSALNDKARIFNNNIEGLYPSLGLPDELDRMEGTAKLDTLYIAVTNDLKLAAHYGLEDKDSTYNAALLLKRNTNISRSAYGELKINVWDKDKVMAADLANNLLRKLNEFHQHIENANTSLFLQKMKDELSAKQKEVIAIEESVLSYKSTNSVYNLSDEKNKLKLGLKDSGRKEAIIVDYQFTTMRAEALKDQIKSIKN